MTKWASFLLRPVPKSNSRGDERLTSLGAGSRHARQFFMNIFSNSILAAAAALALSACAGGKGGTVSAPGKFGSRDTVDRLVGQQITLAKAHFSVGEIDGRNGALTTRATEHYMAAHPGTPAIPAEVKPYTTYTVREADLKFVGPLEPTNEGQAKMKYLTYETTLEMVAEKFHAAQALLVYLNAYPSYNPPLKPGDAVVVPNVEPFLIESVKGNARAGATAGNYVRIQTDRGALEVFNKQGNLLAYYPVSCGSDQIPTPKGEWKIVNQVPLPTFRWDDEMLNKGVRSQDFFMFPPGPNNPVGVFWNGLSKTGVGIHGNPLPDTLFQGRSHGCIRMTNWDVITLPKYVGIGSKVLIE
jgi:lipoprotein-anchoring transpeptidase ErfK/SrfK